MASERKSHSPRIERVVELLRERVEKCGWSYRAIEVKAKWPLGTLALLLAGRRPVTLDQLEALAEILGFRVFDVMTAAYGPLYEDNPAGPVPREVLEKLRRAGGLPPRQA
jgi:transcriptional regulator with XRE-family HTH domain